MFLKHIVICFVNSCNLDSTQSAPCLVAKQHCLLMDLKFTKKNQCRPTSSSQFINKELVLLIFPYQSHPKTIASWSTYWSGSALAGGKQTGATVLDKTTGASKVMMAKSLAYIYNQNQIYRSKSNVKKSSLILKLTKVAALNWP